MALSSIGASFKRSREKIDLDSEKGDPKNVLWGLPKDMVTLILSFLPVKEMMKASVLSRTMREITKNDLLWKNLFERSYVERGITMPIKPSQESWKESYKSLVSYCTFIEGGDELELNHNVAKMNKEFPRTAFGRFHYSGKHKYTVRIDQLAYIGIGVASTRITAELVKGTEHMHHKSGCSIYYYSGTWYCEKERASYSIGFHQDDQIHVYFDVESGQVEYYNGSKLLERCHTIGEDQHKDGLRLGVVLKAHYKTNAAIVSIVDYQPVDAFPKSVDHCFRQ
eukprot:TRINITY_DN2325_c0_g1_i5.p1 TRINITY_DN2325_c0_g1~~TRINITY_DN2325_c0_g1_i5.p1  ORF type:complete len:281 (+),score=36.65 TRINITY_DN2325_c0_g1_i5:91-933(+)